MAFENVSNLVSRPKYLLVWLASAALIMWAYIGPLTNQDEYHALGWVFAISFPILVGGILAGQWYNLAERRSCPLSATGGGALGGLVGISTVACAGCPAVLLGWVGLFSGAGGAILGGPWLKLASLIVLVVALSWATAKD